MYKLDLPVDYKEAAAIERRRNMEEQRKSRIFNSKSRTIGVSPETCLSSAICILGIFVFCLTCCCRSPGYHFYVK